MANLEDVFVTEGVPEFTFVKPPNYDRASGRFATQREASCRRRAVWHRQDDDRKKGPVRNLSGKYAETSDAHESPRIFPVIEAINEASGDLTFVVDDFHRLERNVKEHLANLAKVIAERDNRDGLPKLVIIGINNGWVGPHPDSA